MSAATPREPETPETEQDRAAPRTEAAWTCIDGGRHSWFTEQQTGHKWCHACGRHPGEAAALAAPLDTIRDRWQEARAASEGNRVVESADDRTAFDRGMDHAERLLMGVLRDAAPGAALDELRGRLERTERALAISQAVLRSSWQTIRAEADRLISTADEIVRFQADEEASGAAPDPLAAEK
jgi:hypothetical protein